LDIASPFENKGAHAAFREQAASQDELILIIVYEQHIDRIGEQVLILPVPWRARKPAATTTPFAAVMWVLVEENDR
jgi:hypothetical protein